MPIHWFDKSSDTGSKTPIKSKKIHWILLQIHPHKKTPNIRFNFKTSTHNWEQPTLRCLALIQEQILCAPEGGVSAANDQRNNQGYEDIHPDVSKHQCHNSDQAQRHQDEAVIDDSAEDEEWIVAGEVEEKPADEHHQEDDHGDGVVDEAAEEDD